MSTPRLHVVLHQPEIPGNAGAVGRTCVAVGAKLWLVRPLGFRLTDRHLRRAGLDYWKSLEWQVVDGWDQLLEGLPDPTRKPWFLTKSAGGLYSDAHFEEGDVLVFGSETQGLPRSMLEANRDRCLRIPIRPEARSLNLAVSVAIVSFEAVRQLGSPRPPR